MDPDRHNEARYRLLARLLAGVEMLAGVALVAAAWHLPDLAGTIAQRTWTAGGLLLIAVGFGLFATRAWAAWVTTLLLYGAFFVVLVLMSLWWEAHAHTLRYWLLPFALPLIGVCVYALRPLRGAPRTERRARNRAL